ncbi:MgtC/SapB family protein [Bremerella cremea]|uniref:MgtC/SapB family protein n=1 Tax=Bremerella cremea TaxID=1031537 RepID=UPI0031E55488
MDDWILLANQTLNWDSFLRLALAALCGAVLGWDRERKAKPAGLRTNMLVALGAATFMVIGLDYQNSLQEPSPDWLRIDPFRILSGIIGGVGFLGAGSIIESRGNVHGLTTAATIWVSAATGSACGMGFYGVAVMAIGLGLVTLIAIGFVERYSFQDREAPPARQD